VFKIRFHTAINQPMPVVFIDLFAITYLVAAL